MNPSQTRDPFCPPSYWDLLKETWAANRIASCACEYCHGTDICTIQMCWNTFYGAKPTTNGSSSQFATAKAQSVSERSYGPMHCVKCNEKNDYAEPNRADGSYMCFGCRA